MKKYNKAILLLSSFFLLNIVIIAIYAADRPSQEQIEKFIDNLPPPARQFLQKKGIDLDKLKTDQELQDKVLKMMKDPKLRRKVFETIQQKAKEKSKPVKSEKNRRSDKKSGDLPSIYEVIVRKNLFRPLGWSDKKSGPPFVLCGIVRSSEDKKVLIQRKGNPEGYYVGVGDTIADGYKVEEITENTAKLKKDSEEVVLRLSDWVPRGGTAKPSFGPQPGKPSAKGGKGKSRRKESPSPSEFKLPPGVPSAMIRKILEKEGLTLEEVMRNPELQERLRRQYEPMIREQMQHR